MVWEPCISCSLQPVVSGSLRDLALACLLTAFCQSHLFAGVSREQGNILCRDHVGTVFPSSLLCRSELGTLGEKERILPLCNIGVRVQFDDVLTRSALW